MNSTSLNLDKLRNIVQKFGGHSFSTAQVVHEYDHGDSAVTPEATEQFNAQLSRHAVLLGIQPVAGGSLWQMV